MANQYKIIFTGKLLEGFDHNTVIANLASVAKMEPSKAEKLLLVSKPIALKKGLDREKAKKLARLLTKAGLKVGIKEQEKAVQQSIDVPPVPKQPVQAQARPKNEPKSDNPYAAPVADLGVQNQLSGDWLDTPRKVPASHGWKWISSAAKLFMGEPFKWPAMGFIAAFLSMLVAMVPIIGSLLYYIPFMIFAGGAMLTAQKQMEGNALEVKDIFSGFSHNRNNLALLGLLYLGCMFAIGIVMGLLFFMTLGSSFLPMLLKGQQFDPATFSSPTTILMFFVVILIGLGLSIPIVMAVWFSSPLVALGNRNPVEAFKQSFQACLKNILPFLVYGLAYFGVGIGIIIVFAIMGGLFGALAGNSGGMIMAILPLLFIILFGLPFMVISGLSAYTGFVDIFSTTKGH